MGKVLLNISILNKNYCIFEREKGSKLNASFYDKKGKEFGFVTNEKEIRILNEIIRQLNKRYIRRRDIIFNDESFIRYVNRYTGMSYFAKMEDGSPQSCPYLEYKELYNKYNGKQVFCSGYSKYDENGFDYSENSINNSYDGYWDFQAEPSRNNRSGKNKKNNGLVKKIVLTIAGVAITVLISFSGYKVLSASGLEEIESAEPTVLQAVEEVEKSFNLDDFDTKADTEEEQILQAKYDHISNQLKKVGLDNWEIAVQLDLIAMFEEDKSGITFYYDDKKDEIVYIYENVARATKDSDEVEQVTPPEVLKIITAINENEHLSPNEKQHIIDTYTPIWTKNVKYLNVYELINRYSVLETEFDFTEGGKFLEETMEYNPHENVAGTYSHMGILAEGEEDLGQCYQSKITIYDSPSFDETLKSNSATSTFDHETSHVNGNLGYYSATLLNEGYNQLAQANRTNRYKTESAMAMLFVETFGTETFKEGFYGFDLQSVLTNKVVGKTAQNPAEVDRALYELLQDVEDVLYMAGRDSDYRQDSVVIDKFESIFSTLGSYHELLTGREIEDNQAANLIRDYITGGRSSSLYEKDTEKIDSINLDYDVDTGTLTAQIDAEHGVIPYSVSFVEAEIAPGYSRRNIVLNSTNKYDREYKIQDKDLGYMSR